ncbi:MAG: P-loop NTPase [Pseudomonadota bacterium]
MEFGEKLAKLDCTLGHACQFCPQEDSCVLDKPHHNTRLIEARLEEIDQIIVVLANKGGVGKSTVSANLAAGLAQDGFRVGVADADIHGPNQSRFFGFAVAKTRTTYNGLKTHGFQADGIAHPVKVGSLAFMLEDDTTPIVWRDAYKHDFIHHLIGSFDWGSLDYLIVDMPPGTGNELITLCDMLEGCNVSAVLVSTPQAVAQMDSLKAGRFCKERGLPVIGAVENMAGVVCPHCSEEFHLFPEAGLDAALAALEIPRVAAVPLAPQIAMGSDTGAPVVCAHPDSVAATAFGPLISAVAALGRKDFSKAVAATLGDVFQDNLADRELNAALAVLPEGAELGEEIAALLGQEAGRLRNASEGESRP